MSRAIAVVLLALTSGAVTGAAPPEDPSERVVRTIRVGCGARLGVSLDDVDAGDVQRLKLAGETGALVRGVEPGSPAEKSGLKADDVIVQYQGERVHSAAQLARLVRETPAGRAVALEVNRAGAVQKLTATLEDRRGDRMTGDFDVEIPEIRIPEMRHLEDMIGRQLDRGFQGFPFGGPRRLGIEYLELSDQLAAHFKVPGGVLVSRVDADGPAAKAGVTAGDIIVSLDGKAVRDGGDLREALAASDEAREAKLELRRDGKPVEVTVALAARPERRGRSEGTI
jgi:serine protease Do